MDRLTADKLYGIWDGLTMPWDEKYNFDEETYAKNIKRLIVAKVHGIYTTGSTGEFYALEYDEFCRMVDIQAELCGDAGMPLQIGCNSDSTAKTIRLLEYASTKEAVGAVQVNIPYWMELSDRELLQFFKDIHSACPDMPLVHYNIPRAKRFLTGDDYLRILDVAPNLIGVKFSHVATKFGELQDAIMKTPEISYFVSENFLVSGMQLGARGNYSSLIATNPTFMLTMYEKARAEEWNEAIKMQKIAARFFNEAIAFIKGQNEGVIDPVFDKGLSVAAGCNLGHQRCRPPYIGWKDETVKAMNTWLKKNYPELIFPVNS